MLCHHCHLWSFQLHQSLLGLLRDKGPSRPSEGRLWGLFFIEQCFPIPVLNQKDKLVSWAYPHNLAANIYKSKLLHFFLPAQSVMAFGFLFMPYLNAYTPLFHVFVQSIGFT